MKGNQSVTSSLIGIVIILSVLLSARSPVAGQNGEQELHLFLPVVVEGDEDFRHPLLALAGVDGPLPLFEVLDDPQGRRYAVGEGGSVREENGQQITVSGLFVAERRPMRPEEFDKTDPPLTLPPLPVVNPDLAALIATLPPDALVGVIVGVQAEIPGVQVELERLIASGDINSLTKYEEMRDRLIREQQIDMAALLLPVADAIGVNGGEVHYLCQNMPCLAATIPAGKVTLLATRPDIIELDILRDPLPNPDEPPAPGLRNLQPIVNGVTVRQGAQIQQFFSNGYNGNGVNDISEADNIIVAVVEAGGGYLDHAGFREHNPTSYFRYQSSQNATGKWQCDEEGCSLVNVFLFPGNHAMGAAGIVFGDLSDGQIPSVPVEERPTASGYAPEARAHLYTFSSSSAAVQAFDHIAGLTSSQGIPDLVSNSWGYWESPNCSGQGGVSRAANRLYEDGIAVFAAAHNQGGSATDCQITAPGSAIGVFTVGAHLDGYAGNARTVRTADIYEAAPNPSSWGGNLSEGQNRSIVSITAPGTRANKFNTNGSFSEQGIICCTSLATPTVAGAAATFMDFYYDRISNFIDNPGALYANMLLMGDRQSVGAKINSSPDHRWGTGRLRMRLFNEEGLDGPWVHFSGWTCVSDGEVYDFAVAEGTVLSQDMDAFKAAAYWYDTRHDGSRGNDAGQIADVDLRLVDANTTGLLRTDNDFYDNKARIYYEDVGGRRVNLRLVGYNVEGHTDPVCGEDAIRVFFAFFAEDSDRESPTFNPFNGTGIFPEGQ